MIAIFTHAEKPTSLVNLLVTLSMVLYASSCTSTGSDQLPIDSHPFAFTDAKSGMTIERVLIVPKYSTSTGVSSGAGHGPGFMTQSSFLAFAFVYQTGEEFAPKQPDSKGFVVGRPGDFFVGRGVSIQGVIVIAPGYRSQWVWRLWERPANMNVPLEPLGSNESRESQRRLASLLGSSRIRGVDLTESEREIFSTIKDFDIDVRFSDAEQQLVQTFLKAN